MSAPNYQQRSMRGRDRGGSNDDRWEPYPPAHGHHPQAQGFRQYRPQQVGPQVQIPTRHIDSGLEKAFAILFSVIDYSSLPQKPPSPHDCTQWRHEILADSLNYIEHLENTPVSGCARNTISYFLIQKLKRKVPEQYFLYAGVQQERFRVKTFVPSPLSVAQAVTARIRELKSRREREVREQTAGKTRETRTWRTITRVRRKQDLEEGEIASISEYDISEDEGDEEHAGKSAEDGTDSNGTAMGGSTSQQQVERFMDKIEQWIACWQTGKLRNDDWLSMKDCMDLPD